MAKSEIKVYGYRWVILAVFALITILIEMQWLTFAPIAREAKIFYGVSAMQIDVLSMIFMGIFVIMCIPASYVIDTYGIRIGIGIGTVLTGIFALMKGICAENYTMVLIAQIGLAVAQPFILNAATKVAVRWFPIHERATAVGLATLSQFVGIILVMMITPAMLTSGNGGPENIKNVMMTYGIIAAAGAIVVLLFLRERPATPPGTEVEDERVNYLEGFRQVMSNKDMRLAMILFFIGLGVFNAVSTVVDQISEMKGFDIVQSGDIGGAMLITAIVGAIIFPIVSDKIRKRKPFIILGMALMIPGLVGLTFSTEFTLVLISAGILGFFLLGAGGPVGFQYAAEISSPGYESSTQGVLLLAGQVSGIIFIVGMNMIGMKEFLIAFVVLAVINVILTTRLSESKRIITG